MEKIILPSIKNSEKTPLVEQLLEIIKQLQEEIARLKKHKGKPKISPSKLDKSLEDEEEESKGKNRKPSEKRRSRGRSKSTQKPDRIETRRVENIPKGSRFKGYRTYRAQELILKRELIEYQLERWQLPDGSFVVAGLPEELEGTHFGSTLQSYILHQYHHQNVTQPLLLKQLHELGFLISSGELNKILIEGKEAFHDEKAQILSAGLEVSNYIHVDDTGARHNGKNGYCTQIGNELFTWFESTGSKSRINFLELLRQRQIDYELSKASFDYLKKQKFPGSLKDKLLQGQKYFANKTAWRMHLKRLGIEQDRHIKVATEAALIGSVLKHGFSVDTVIISDDAGQFNIFQHALCWIHMERNINKLIPLGEHQAKALKFVRTSFWALYQDIKYYKKSPTLEKQIKLEKDFDILASQVTDFQLLNFQLKQLAKNKGELLQVLKRPDLPLHNNLSERDIREYVKRRKISGGTRSDEGKKCRDTFASLKKTAIKLNVGFWDYLTDRMARNNQLPSLSDLIRQSSLKPTCHFMSTAPGF